MFNPRPSSGISHSFSKSSSKLDTLTRVDSQNLSTEQPLGNNLQDRNYEQNKYKDYISVTKRNEEKQKTNKNILDFETTYTSNSNLESVFGSKSSVDLSTEGVFEKNYLLRLMFTFERMSKMSNRKVVSEPLQFHSVEVTPTYKEELYDKNEKLKKMLYKQNATKRTFFDNQSRLLKGVRTLGIKGVYREDMGHETLEGDKAFEIFDMRKINETVKFKETLTNTFKETNKEYRGGLSSEYVRQFSREANGSEFTRNLGSREELSEMNRRLSRDQGNDFKYTRENSTSEINRLMSREQMPRTFSREEGTSELTRHYPEASQGEGSRQLQMELSPGSLNMHFNTEQTNQLGRHMSREMAMEQYKEPLKNIQHSWDLEEYQSKQNYMTNKMGRASGFGNTFMEYNENKESKENNYFKEKEKEHSFLERLLDKQLENTENTEGELMNFPQNYSESRKQWSEVNLQWQYMDPQGIVHGPFSSEQMYEWHVKNFFPQNLRMRYNTKMAWVPFGEVFPPNSIPFKSLPNQFTQLVTTSKMSQPSKETWSQSTNNYLSGFQTNLNKSTHKSANMLAPSNMLNTNTSLLGSSGTSQTLLGSSGTNTNLLAPSNLLGASSLLGPPTGSPGLLGSSNTNLLGHGPSSGGGSAGKTTMLGAGNLTTGLLGQTSSTTTANTGMMNNRLDNLWNTTQSTVHPITSMSNIHMAVSNLSLNTVQPTNHLNKHMQSQNHMVSKQTTQLTKTAPEMLKTSSPSVTKQYPITVTKEYAPTPTQATTPAPMTTATATTTTTAAATAAAHGKQYLQPGASVTKGTTTTAGTTMPTPVPNERKWNTPQVEVSSLLEIMELEKKNAQERVVKTTTTISSPPPKPVQTGWNMSNVATNNLSESDDFPSLSTVSTTTTTSSNQQSNTTAGGAGKKFGKHITMPLETFIEKHTVTSTPQFTESFSSKLLGNKH